MAFEVHTNSLKNCLDLQWSIVIDRRKYLKLAFYSILVAYPEIMKGYIL